MSNFFINLSKAGSVFYILSVDSPGVKRLYFASAFEFKCSSQANAYVRDSLRRNLSQRRRQLQAICGNCRCMSS